MYYDVVLFQPFLKVRVVVSMVEDVDWLLRSHFLADGANRYLQQYLALFLALLSVSVHDGNRERCENVRKWDDVRVVPASVSVAVHDLQSGEGGDAVAHEAVHPKTSEKVHDCEEITVRRAKIVRGVSIR